MVLDRARNGLRIDVPGDHDHAPLRRVPVAIEGDELVTGRIADDVLDPDRRPLRMEGIREQEAQHRLERVGPGGVARPLLAQDHPALRLDLVSGEGQPPGDLAENAKALVDQRRVVTRHVQLVDRLIETGARVGVSTEGEPRPLQQGHQLAGLKVLGAFEGHVLDEVGEAALRLALHERASLDQQAQANPLGWGALGQDGVRRAVREPTPDDVAVVLQRPVPGDGPRRRLRPSRRGRDRRAEP